MSQTTIKIPSGKKPYLIPGKCKPKLEVYSIHQVYGANLLYEIPPHKEEIKLDQSNHYRLIFYNEELTAEWKYSYKIGIKQGDNFEILLNAGASGKGQKFFAEDIKLINA